MYHTPSMKTLSGSLVSLRAFLTYSHPTCRPCSLHAPRCPLSRPPEWHGRPKSAAWGARRPAAAAAGSSPGEESQGDGAQPAPQLPLCERRPEHSAQLGSLLAWRDRALRAVSRVGDAWAQEDDGPSQAELETELNWLLDDAVAGVLSGSGSAQPATWRFLERGLRAQEPATQAAQVVQLRAPLEALETLWRQRLDDRAPLQYLTSAAHWRDMVLSVGPGILIPRPETEQMIDFVAEAAAANPELAVGPWADLGTGSGALAIGVARQLPTVPQVWAVDLNPTAVAYAAFNARRMGVADRVSAVQGSWFQPVQRAGAGQLAGIVSNPPYVTSQQMPSLQAEVGRHEPHLALDGGAGLGIDCLVPICTGAVGMLRPGGFLALETGGGEQALYIAELLRRLRDTAQQEQQEQEQEEGEGGWGSGGEGPLAFRGVAVRRDLFGVDRFVTAIRAG